LSFTKNVHVQNSATLGVSFVGRYPSFCQIYHEQFQRKKNVYSYFSRKNLPGNLI